MRGRARRRVSGLMLPSNISWPRVEDSSSARPVGLLSFADIRWPPNQGRFRCSGNALYRYPAAAPSLLDRHAASPMHQRRSPRSPADLVDALPTPKIARFSCSQISYQKSGSSSVIVIAVPTRFTSPVPWFFLWFREQPLIAIQYCSGGRFDREGLGGPASLLSEEATLLVILAQA